jgi:hypothetical protein
MVNGGPDLEILEDDLSRLTEMAKIRWRRGTGAK